jgi:dephospho-CoA kinase
VRFRLGITGGIGSGKSTICKVFNVLGIPVFLSDDEARVIMDGDPVVREELNKIVGFNIYESKGLDRPKLAEIIFNDTFILEKVNQLVHPRVLNAFNNWTDKQDSEYVILETALLLESKIDWRIDKILAVIAPIEERILRVMDRNSMSGDQVLERIKNQVSENEMIRRSDYVINNADSDMILPDLIRIHNDILNIIKN